MIICEKTSIFNFENAIRGARNPMNSWERSDSYINEKGDFVFGNCDLELARRLCKSGTDHRKFMRQIFISTDITAPLYWWKEFDTYKVGTVANSTSTMHKIHSKAFVLEDFSTERMIPFALNAMKDLICVLEKLRLEYNNTKDKTLWDSIIQLLPTSYNQKRTVTLNYENALAIYNARKEHKLKEWRDFCEWILTLTWFKELYSKD